MLSAKSVAYTEGGGSGTYFVGLLKRLGIIDEMKPRLRPGDQHPEAVASGAVEMTVTGIVPILRSPGIELVGPLPPELQSYSEFHAGVSAASKNADAANSLLAFLRRPESIAVFTMRGVEPMPATQR